MTYKSIPSSNIVDMSPSAIRSPKTFVMGGSLKTLTQLIKSLFANNEQGFAYDPSDMGTMFQDATGTVPVTGAGQAVGLILDKSKGLVLGSEIILNGQFTNGFTNWLNSNNHWSVVNGRAYHPASANLNALEQVFSAKASMLKVEFNIEVIQGTAQILFVPFATVVNIGVTPAKQVTLIAPAGTTNIQFKRLQPNTAEFYIDNVSIKELTGNHAYQTNAASRPLLQRNATTGAYYLEFDGSDDFLQTSNIDFTATDKISLFAGVRKLSDATVGVICELSTSVAVSSNNGVFALLTPGTATLTTFRPYSKGTVLANTNSVPTAPAPNSFVGTVEMSISMPKIDVRVDGVNRVFTNEDQGTGNYGNYPLYIGRRGGTTLPFNGHIYSLIGVGRLSTDAEATSLEKSIAKNVGVTL